MSLDGDLLKDFNQLSDIDLEASLGKIRTSNSLNEYMSKIDFCYFENDEVIQMYSNDSVASDMLLRQVFEFSGLRTRIACYIKIMDSFMLSSKHPLYIGNIVNMALKRSIEFYP